MRAQIPPILSRALCAASSVVGHPIVRNFLLPPAIARCDMARAEDVLGQGPKPADAPIFILSAGWGSGSTLLQRLVISSGEAMIWGEPLGHALPIPRMASIMGNLSDEWPPPEHFQQPQVAENLSGAWVANMTPPLEDWLEGQRAIFRRTFEEPARRFGVRRWGIKGTRWTTAHAGYLRLLFPEARFLLVYRDVLDAYRSSKKLGGFMAWPDYPIASPLRFAHHWMHLMTGFLNDAERLGAEMIRFEDLKMGQFDAEGVARYLGLSRIDRSVLDKKVGQRSGWAGITRRERLLLRSVAEPMRIRLGYR